MLIVGVDRSYVDCRCVDRRNTDWMLIDVMKLLIKNDDRKKTNRRELQNDQTGSCTL